MTPPDATWRTRKIPTTWRVSSGAMWGVPVRVLVGEHRLHARSLVQPMAWECRTDGSARWITNGCAVVVPDVELWPCTYPEDL